MADFPCLPLWTDAYLADTSHLTTEEHGAYLLLLIHAWRNADCSLPDDDVFLGRLSCMSASKWRLSKPIIMAFWTLDKRRKKWVQKRLKKERLKAAEKKQSARDSAASRWKTTEKSGAKSMRSQCSPEPEPYPNGKTSVFPTGARAREKPRGWVERKNHSQAFNDLISRIEDHEHNGTEDGGGSALEFVPRLPAIGAGGR